MPAGSADGAWRGCGGVAGCCRGAGTEAAQPGEPAPAGAPRPCVGERGAAWSPAWPRGHGKQASTWVGDGGWGFTVRRGRAASVVLVWARAEPSGTDLTRVDSGSQQGELSCRPSGSAGYREGRTGSPAQVTPPAQPRRSRCQLDARFSTVDFRSRQPLPHSPSP